MLGVENEFLCNWVIRVYLTLDRKWNCSYGGNLYKSWLFQVGLLLQCDLFSYFSGSTVAVLNKRLNAIAAISQIIFNIFRFFVNRGSICGREAKWGKVSPNGIVWKILRLKKVFQVDSRLHTIWPQGWGRVIYTTIVNDGKLLLSKIEKFCTGTV